MGDRPKGDFSASSLHTSMLEQVVGRHGGCSLRVPKWKEAAPHHKVMGFSQKVKRALIVKSNLIIGMLDTGVWPESVSFNDNGKIIGAHYYRSTGSFLPGDIPSRRDSEGHGTHTASTVAGRVVKNASLFGLGAGTARRGVPSARIRVYKICWSDGCYDADILAAFAIADGGVYVNTFSLKQSMYTLVYGGNVPNTKDGYDGSVSRYCFVDSLDETLVKDKIVLCDQLSDGEGPLYAGGIGAIMQDDGFKDLAFSFPLSASYLGSTDGAAVFLYINKTSKPTATIEKSIAKKGKLAPFVVSFSSRGPNPITRDIRKLDLAAPGVDIVAAWSEATTVTGITGDERVVPYNVISGTSMSCPHASGAAAYVKSLNELREKKTPKSPVSLLFFSAFPMSATKNPEAEFAYGSGHINPVKAANPGLIYNAGESDYIQFLCDQGYSNESLQLVTGSNTTTCSASNNGTVWDLNYPSFALSGPVGAFVTWAVKKGRPFY
ncbi:hypothetical protein RHGRI_007940 [Rhododendron griersonianum]|uniref:Peptidase S8/S53 domain-containing protein n=1 Tax=Rhododendron griersonianum TaxID=479676 RepID=A0AAV6KYU3_9ERIC|nr:hypothetical protein RHGRI_007940 [Rhododendron griersonianum]